MVAERLERMKEIGWCGRLDLSSFAKPELRCRFDFIPASGPGIVSIEKYFY